MTNEMKLLRAFIEASGFDIDTTEDIKRFYRRDDIMDNGDPKENAMPESIIKTTDYKVTKKSILCSRMDINLNTYCEVNKKDLAGARLYFYEVGSDIPKNAWLHHGRIAHANPVIASSYGEFPNIFIDKPYRVVIEDRKGNIIFEDNYESL